VKIVFKYERVLRALMIAGFSRGAQAQTLLDQWNVNNATGNNTPLTAPPRVIDASMSRGVLANCGGGGRLSAPAGAAVHSPASSFDLGVASLTAYRSTAGVLSAGTGKLSARNTFTASLGFNLNASAKNFSMLNGGALLSRLVDSAAIATDDGDELYFPLSTRTTTLVVADNNSPVLSATQIFSVVVNPDSATMPMRCDRVVIGPPLFA
jgi:hypothetical protein